MPSTGKLCALVILACILGPIAAGYLLPSGESEDKTGYAESNPVNVSQDLYNNTEPYSATNTGISNNLYWGAYPQYVSVSQTYGSVRAWNTNYTVVDMGSTNVTLNSSWFEQFSNSQRIEIGWGSEHRYIMVNGERLTGIYYSGGDGYFTDLYQQYPITSTVTITDTSHVKYMLHTLSGYADPTAGVYVQSGEWRNYLQNESIDMVFRDAGSGYNIGIDGFNGDLQQIVLTRSGAEVTAGYYTKQNNESDWVLVNSLIVGNYRDVLLRFTIADNGGVTMELSGLSYAEKIGDDVQNRIVNLILLAEAEPAQYWNIPYREFLGFYNSAANSVIAYCDNVTYTAGTYSVMLDSTLNPALYFPAQSCSAELHSISQYGSSITLPGNNSNLPITGGYVTITGTENGETVTQDVKLRELTLLAVYDADTQLYSCYIGNVLLGQQAAPTITLNGAWLLTAYAYKTEAYTYTTLEWDLGTFNLDTTGFCLVGLACSFVAFVGLGLWGRRSGGKVAALAFVALLCAFVYLTILMEA